MKDQKYENGIDIVEIGFPDISQSGSCECQCIAQFVELDMEKRSFLSGLDLDMMRNVMAMKQVGCEIVNIYVPMLNQAVLDQFDADKYGDTPEGKRQWVLDKSVEMVGYAKGLGFKARRAFVFWENPEI